MTYKKRWLITFSLLLTLAASATPPSEEGKNLFNARCASCHNVHKVLVGPALAGVQERRNIEWIVKFVQSSQTLIKSGDKDAAAVFAKFNNVPMPDHPDLTADNIKNILSYIKEESAKSAEVSAAPFRKPSKLRPAYKPLGLSNWGFFISLGAGITVLVLALLALVKVKEVQYKNEAV